MRRNSLARVLARQWVLFTLCLASLAIVGGLLLLFVLEDSFIDRRLRELAPAALQAPDGVVLPPRFALHTLAEAPVELRERTRKLRAGGIAEFRLADGRYVHVLRADDDGVPRLLTYDVTDQLTVTAMLPRVAPYLLAMLAALLLLAYALARAFVRRTARRAQDLMASIRRAETPAVLRRQADAEPVQEFADLACLFADTWEQRLAALDREHETLAFLAHELRTPLQSARTSLALVREGRDPEALLARLTRAVGRLERATNSVLWLSSDTAPAGGRVPLLPLVQGLVDEFEALAASRRQQLRLSMPQDIVWHGPREVLEAVLGNLLLNAIQHGGPGAITLVATDAAITVRNPRATTHAPIGFGIGLQVVQRLCARCGWCLQRIDDDEGTEHRLLASGAEGVAAHLTTRSDNST